MGTFIFQDSNYLKKTTKQTKLLKTEAVNHNYIDQAPSKSIISNPTI